MENYRTSHNLATLRNGKKVLIRCLKEQDRDGLIEFFKQAPPEDVQFCREDVKDPRTVACWLNQENSRIIMALVAMDVENNQPVASLNLYRGRHAALNVGEIQQVLVARPYQGFGLGSLMLDEMIGLAVRERLSWLKVEVNIESKRVIKAFESRGFKIRATFEDYFQDMNGQKYDAALMMRSMLQKEEDF